MKFLLMIECKQKDLESEIKSKVKKKYEIILQLKFIGTLQLPNKKELIVYEFWHERDKCNGILFVIKEETGYFDEYERIKRYWIYSFLRVRVCPSCRAPLEGWMKYCPHCGAKAIWEVC